MGICSGFEICTLKVAFGKQIIPSEFSHSQHHKTILFIQVENPHWFLDVQNSFLEAKYPLQNYSITKYVLLSPSVPRTPKEHVSLSMDRCLYVCETVHTCGCEIQFGKALEEWHCVKLSQLISTGYHISCWFMVQELSSCAYLNCCCIVYILFNSLGRKWTVLVSLAPINVSGKSNVLAFVLHNFQS